MLQRSWTLANHAHAALPSGPTSTPKPPPPPLVAPPNGVERGGQGRLAPGQTPRSDPPSPTVRRQRSEMLDPATATGAGAPPPRLGSQSAEPQRIHGGGGAGGEQQRASSPPLPPLAPHHVPASRPAGGRGGAVPPSSNGSAASRHSSPLLRTPSTAEALSLDTASTHHSRESARPPPSGRTDGSPRGKAAAGDEAGRNRTMVAAKRDVARGRMGVAPPKKAFEGKGGGYAAAKV